MSHPAAVGAASSCPRKFRLTCDITLCVCVMQPLQLARGHLGVICLCPSSLFSTSYLRANIPSVVPLPCLNSSCSSPIPLTLRAYSAIHDSFQKLQHNGLTTQLLYFSWVMHISLSFLYSDYQPHSSFLCELPLSLAGVQQLICRSYSNSLSHSHHLYSHFINACLSFRLGLQDKQ